MVVVRGTVSVMVMLAKVSVGSCVLSLSSAPTVTACPITTTGSWDWARCCISPPSTIYARYNLFSSSSKQNISESSNFQQFPYDVIFNPSGSANSPNTNSVCILISNGSLMPLAANSDLKICINTRSIIGYLFTICSTNNSPFSLSITTRNSAKNFLN